jgi:hypothetical protein
MRILFIGNSYTGRNDLPRLLTEIAVSAPVTKVIETEQIIANGASLRQHWNAGTALEALKRANWDYVILQEQSTLPLKNAQRFHENVHLFDAEIKKYGSQTMLYLTWARQHALETQAALTQATMAIARETGALVAPVGVAWQVVLQAYPELTLYDKDGSHPSPAGSYMAACVFYAVLFNESPVGLAIPERIKVSSENGVILQQMAWQTAMARK